MPIVLDGTNGITTPDLESSGPVTGTTASFSGNVTLGTSVLTTPAGSAPSYTCRAWVNFNGTGTVAIRASGNVSSITDLGTGEYTVNMAAAMPDLNYAVTLGMREITGNGYGGFLVESFSDNRTTSAFKVGTLSYNISTRVDTSLISVAVFR